MPFENEHACRLQSPGQFDDFRRENGAATVDGKSVDHIYGISGDSSELQAIRYPTSSWSADAARSHCRSRDSIQFEQATNDRSNMSSNNSYRNFERKTEDGESFLVTDVVAQREDVYAYPDGNGGIQREYAPGEELTTNAEAWDGTPLVIDHPQSPDGRDVSVNHPEAETTTVGEFREPRGNSDNDALAGKTWIQESEIGNHNGVLDRYVQTVEEQGAGEVSTGYNVGELDRTQGTFDGQEYDAIQRNIQPDHLALLTGSKTGDCNVEEDGCGVGIAANWATNSPNAFRANLSTADDPAGEDSGPGIPSDATQMEVKLGRRVAEAIGIDGLVDRLHANSEPDESAESDGGASSPPSDDTNSGSEPMKDDDTIETLVEEHGFSRENLEHLDGTECLTRIHEAVSDEEEDGGDDGGTEASTGGDDPDEDVPDVPVDEYATPETVREIMQEELDAQIDRVVEEVEKARANERHVELVANSEEVPLEKEDLEDMDASAVEKLADEMDDPEPGADAGSEGAAARANYAGTPTGPSFEAPSDDDDLDVEVPVGGALQEPDTDEATTEGDD